MRKSHKVARFVGILMLGGALALTATACGGLDEAEAPVEASEIDEVDDGKLDSASVKASTSAASYTTSENIDVAVKNAHAHTIYLPGCNAVTLQRRENNKWVDAGPERLCFWEGLATKIAAKATLKTSLLPKAEGTYRIKASYKTSCAAQAPFSSCTGPTRNAYSPKFMVKPPACAPVLCELYCANGFDVDEHGCEVCRCKPAANDCRQTGCGSGKYCTFCWTHFACIPNGAMC